MTVYTPSALAAGSLIAVAMGTAVAPKFVARVYGIPTDDDAALSFVRSVGARDVALGLIIAAFAARRESGALGIVLACTAVAGLGDFVVVAAKRDVAPNLVIHATGLVGLLALAGWAFRGSSEI